MMDKEQKQNLPKNDSCNKSIALVCNAKMIKNIKFASKTGMYFKDNV